MSEAENTAPESTPVARAARTQRTIDVVDRIVISRCQNEKVKTGHEPLNERFEGFGRITKNDIADFIFRKYPQTIPETYMIELASEFYDEVHWTAWALEKIKQSKKDGGDLTLDELVSRRKGIEQVAKRATSRKPLPRINDSTINRASPAPDISNDAPTE